MHSKIGIVFLFTLLVASSGWAQYVSPTPISLVSGSYTQDWGSASFSSFSSGFTGGIHSTFVPTSLAEAETFLLNGNKTPSASTSAGNLSFSGGFYGYYDGSNAMLALTASNVSGSGGNALVMAIDTTGLDRVDLGYDLVVANASASLRGAGIVVQYRAGGSGDWTSIDTSYFISKSAPPANGTSTSFSYSLATGALDESLVEIRWVGYIEQVGGAYTSIGIDNITLSTVPEPASYALLGGLLTFVGIVFGRKRRRT